MFPVLTRLDEQKIGIAVKPIPGKTAVLLVESGSNSMHFGGRAHNMYTSSIGKKLAAGCQYGFSCN
jgi:hypothetical protein